MPEFEDVRIQISSDDEKTIKQIIKKYRGDYCC